MMVDEKLSERLNESMWNDFCSLIPENAEEIAKRMNIMKGAKQDKDFINALHTLMIHLGVGTSLKETAVHAKLLGLSNISSVSLFNRLVKFGPFFQTICNQMLDRNMLSIYTGNNLHFNIIDASDIKEPGITGSHYRIHYSFSLPNFCCNYVEVTSAAGKGTGETLTRFPVLPGDYVIADRGYSSISGIAHVAHRGGHVLIRLNHKALPLFTIEKKPFQLVKMLSTLTQAGDAKSWNCLVHNPEENEWFAGRICVIRKDAESIQRSRKEEIENARRKGRSISEETLFINEYTVLFTTFEKEKFSLRKILAIYRWRWQIELVFKRFKSLLALGCLPKTTDESSKAWLYGKMFLALLIEKLSYQQCAFSPWRQLKDAPVEFQRQLMEAF